MAKGCSLMSREGADELTRILVDTGYGNNKQLAETICANRDEVAARIYDHILNDDDLKNRIEDIVTNHLSDEDDEYYDLDEVI